MPNSPLNLDQVGFLLFYMTRLLRVGGDLCGFSCDCFEHHGRVSVGVLVRQIRCPVASPLKQPQRKAALLTSNTTPCLSVPQIVFIDVAYPLVPQKRKKSFIIASRRNAARCVSQCRGTEARCSLL